MNEKGSTADKMDRLVECPICLQKFSRFSIEAHVEYCLSCHESSPSNSLYDEVYEDGLGYLFPQHSGDEKKPYSKHLQSTRLVTENELENFKIQFEALYKEPQTNEKHLKAESQSRVAPSPSDDFTMLKALKKQIVGAASKLGLFAVLPQEIFILIFQYFDRNALSVVMATCKDLKLICDSDYFWKHRYQKDFEQSGDRVNPQLSWKDNYREGEFCAVVMSGVTGTRNY
jgi:hypothetical protein